MPSRTYTADQPYQRYSMVSGDIKFNPTGSHIVTPNMGWQKVPESRWIWLLDGMFYIEPNGSLTPAYPAKAVSPASPVPAVTIRAAVAEAMVQLGRIERAL